MRLTLLAAAILGCAPLSLAAQGPAADSATIKLQQFEASLHYRTGTFPIGDGIATATLPSTLRYLDAADTKRLLTEGWGNPPDAVHGVLGMLIPAEISPLAEEGWGIIVTFDEDGYVSDSDAATIDYTKLLQDLQKSTEEANKSRTDDGYPAMHLLGWAEPPRYDGATHKMYWAKELTVEGGTNHTLNYNIRILGRRGVLVLDAVAGMPQLEEVRQRTPEILSSVDFNAGHRYTDFVAGTDHRAAYGVAGLILGAAAVKTGLLKGIWIAILALKKVILAGFVAVAAWVKRLFGGKKKDKVAPPPPTAPAA